MWSNEISVECPNDCSAAVPHFMYIALVGMRPRTMSSGSSEGGDAGDCLRSRPAFTGAACQTQTRKGRAHLSPLSEKGDGVHMTYTQHTHTFGKYARLSPSHSITVPSVSVYWAPFAGAADIFERYRQFIWETEKVVSVADEQDGSAWHPRKRLEPHHVCVTLCSASAICGW